MNEIASLWIAAIGFYLKGFSALVVVVILAINRGTSPLARACLRMAAAISLVSFIFGTVYLLSTGGKDGGIGYVASSEFRNNLRSAGAIAAVVAGLVFLWLAYILIRDRNKIITKFRETYE